MHGGKREPFHTVYFTMHFIYLSGSTVVQRPKSMPVCGLARTNKCANVCMVPGVPSKVSCVQFPRIGSGSTATMTRIKCLLKMNEGIH